MPLPNFIIGGARRGGSTSLYYTIREHPQIYLYPHSELNYFTEEELNGRKWHSRPADSQHWEQTHSIEAYAGHFVDGAEAAAVGHKGADLLFWQACHERMARYIPDARFIFTLRQPVDRAWSHYWVERAKGRETLSFEEAIEKEDQRAGESDWARFHLSYRLRGCYAQGLTHFLGLFPKENILIVTLEQTIADPAATLQRIYHFLNVDPQLGLDMAGTRRKQNWAMELRPWARQPAVRPFVNGYETIADGFAKLATRSKSSRRSVRNFLQRPFRVPIHKVKMSASCRVELNRFYAPHIAALEQVLERPLAEWKT